MDHEILNPKSDTLVLDESDLKDFCKSNGLEYQIVDLKDLESFESKYAFVHSGATKDQFNGGNTNHWMFIYGRMIFDSYGLQEDFLFPQWTQPVELKPKRIQEYGSNVCGEYCCTFYKFVHSGIDPNDENMGLEYCDSLGFSENRGRNDRLVQEAYTHLGGEMSDSDSGDEGHGVPTSSQRPGTQLPQQPGLPMTLPPSSSQPEGLPSGPIPNPTKTDSIDQNGDTDFGIVTTQQQPPGIIPDGTIAPETTMIPSTGKSGAIDVVNAHHSGELEGGAIYGTSGRERGYKKKAIKKEPGTDADAPEGAMAGAQEIIQSMDSPAMPMKLPTTLSTSYNAPDVPPDMQLLFPTIPDSALEPMMPNLSNKVAVTHRPVVGVKQGTKRLNHDGTVQGAKRVKGVINVANTIQTFVPHGSINVQSTRAMPFQYPQLTILTAVPQIVTLPPGLQKNL